MLMEFRKKFNNRIPERSASLEDVDERRVMPIEVAWSVSP
jgi:hypothetical protein